jgi:hypothetical protein
MVLASTQVKTVSIIVIVFDYVFAKVLKIEDQNLVLAAPFVFFLHQDFICDNLWHVCS